MYAKIATIVAILCISSTSPAPSQTYQHNHEVSKRSIDISAGNGNTNEFLLPDKVMPLHYDLYLEPNLDEGSYKGKVSIQVRCILDTDTITFHVDEDLKVSHSEVLVTRIPTNKEHSLNSSDEHHSSSDMSSKSVNISSTRKDLQKQWYVISLADKLLKGLVYQIDLSFNRPFVTERSEAFFLSSYETHRTKEKRLFAATRMRPNHARNVFPCFDGPMYKATFNISVSRKRNMMALSNMPIAMTYKNTNRQGYEIDMFQKTPLMSTFSLAVIISDLGFVTPINYMDGKGPSIRVFGRSHFLSQLQGAADLAPHIVTFFQDYLDTPFPLPELNLIALPHYSAPYPADLWGVIIFREDDLIGESMQFHLSNEIVYQWIGHLVTPFPKPEEIHINKALVNYLSSVRALKPSDQVACAAWGPPISYSLYYEYSKLHPYANLAAQKEDIRISKTQWLLRMLNYTLTESVFKTSLRQFIHERQHKIFIDDDLFNAMTSVAWQQGVLLKSILVGYIVDSWVQQDRFPVVSVTRNYEEHTAHIEQHVFLRDRPKEGIPFKDTMLWWVPIQYLVSDNLELSELQTTTWMEEQKDISIGDLPDGDKFIIVNPEEIGMFMVNYDAHNWNMISEFLKSDLRTRISVGTRAKLLHDAWNLALGGELNFGTALNMTLFLKHETEYTVWNTFFLMIDHLGRHISGTVAGRKFEKYVQQVVEPLYNSLGEKQDSEDEMKSKMLALSRNALCSVGQDSCIEKARVVYSQWMDMDDPEEGNPVADQYLCPIFRWGNDEEWEFGLQRWINFPEDRVQSEKSYLLKRLAGCTRDSNNIDRLLNMSLIEDNGNFSESDVRLILNMLTGDAAGFTALFKFVSRNWNEIRERYLKNHHLWEYLISRAVYNFKTQEGLDMVSELYVAHMGQFGTAEQIVEDALKKIKEEAAWSAINLPIIEYWLDAHLEDRFMNPLAM